MVLVCWSECFVKRSEKALGRSSRAFLYGPLAQLAELPALNRNVRGSSPRRPTVVLVDPHGGVGREDVGDGGGVSGAAGGVWY